MHLTGAHVLGPVHAAKKCAHRVQGAPLISNTADQYYEGRHQDLDQYYKGGNHNIDV